MADPAQPQDRRLLRAEPLEIEQLVTEHGAVLYRYAYRLTGLAADAEDLTQQAFLTAIGKLGQLREPAAVRAWLCAVLRRIYFRGQRKPRPQPVADLDADVDLLAIDVPEELEFDSEELQSAINELPDEFKSVVVGFYFEECSYKELAERLELPIGTVMSRLSRAKGFLRTRLLGTSSRSAPTQAFLDSCNSESRGAAGQLRNEAR